MTDLKPTMSSEEFAGYVGEHYPGMESAALALHTLLDPADGNKDGQVSFTEIPYPELCEALRSPDFLEKIFMDRTQVIVPKESEAKLDQIKALIRGYAKHLQTIEVDTTPDQNGRYVGLRNGTTVMRIDGLPKALMEDMQRQGTDVIRLVVDGRSLSEPSQPMLVSEGRQGIFEPKSYLSDVSVEGGTKLYPDLEINTIPYAKAGFLSGDSAIEVVIGGLALTAAAVYFFSGRRGARARKAAPITAGQTQRLVRTPRLKLPDQQMRRLQEATTQPNLPTVVMSRPAAQSKGRPKSLAKPRAAKEIPGPAPLFEEGKGSGDCQMIDIGPLIAAGIIPARPKPTARAKLTTTRPKPPTKRPEPVRRDPIVEKEETMIMGDTIYRNGQWRQMTPQEIAALNKARGITE